MNSSLAAKVVFFFLFNLSAVCGESFFTAGPTVHVYLGKHQNTVGLSAEISYWNTDGDIPLSIDIGIEKQKRAVNLYSEMQSLFHNGSAVLGFSLGPVWQFRRAGRNCLGIQTSLWSFGGELRYRRIDRQNFIAPGLLLKVPLVTPEELNLELHPFDEII